MAAKELKTTISLEGSVGASLQKAFDKASGMADKSSKHIGTVMSKLGGFATGALKVGFAAAATGIAAVGTAAVAGAKGAIELGQQFEQASNTIRIGTGATGEDLEKLNKSFDEVYKSVPTSMEAASQAIAGFNTRLGLTGPELEGVSKQAIQVSNLLGDDLTSVIEESSQAFQQWDISADDMGKEMDYIFKLSQSTGVGFTQLMSTTQQFGAQMQELGFSFEESAALLGQLDKAGINSGEVMGALKKSVGVFAKEGLSASEGLETYMQKIKEAGSSMEATAIASEIFGSKAGSTMAAAIREGTLSVTDLVNELNASDESIMKAAEDTETFPQKLQKLKATAEVALKPIASNFMDMANNAIPLISEAIEEIIPEVQGFLGELAPVFGDAVNAILPLISSAVKKITPLLKNALTAVPGIVNTIKGAISNIQPMINNALPMIKQGIDGVMNGIKAAMPFIQEIASAAIPAFQAIGSALMEIGQTAASTILPIIQQVGSTMATMLTPLITQIFNTISSLMPVVTPFIQSLMTTLGALYQNILLPIGTFIAGQLISNIQNVLSTVTPVISGIITALQGVLDFLTGVFTGDWNKAWEGIKTAFTGIWNAMKAVVTGLINTVINGINKVITGLNNVVGAAGEAIGMNIKIPTIPQFAGFAKGGTVTSPTLAMVGEGGAPETIVPHTNTAESRKLLAAAARGVLGNNTTITGGSNDSRTFNITYSPVIQGAGLTEQNLQDNFEEFKRFFTQYMKEEGREVWA